MCSSNKVDPYRIAVQKKITEAASRLHVENCADEIIAYDDLYK